MQTYLIQITEAQLRIIHEALQIHLRSADEDFEEVEALVDLTNLEGPYAPMPSPALNGFAL